MPLPRNGSENEGESLGRRLSSKLSVSISSMLSRLSSKSDSGQSRSSGSPRYYSQDSSVLSRDIFWGRTEGSVEEKYDLFEEIGRGAFGVVRRAKDKTSGRILCCKTINKECLNEHQLREVRHEAEVMLHLRGHPNIVTVMGVFEDERQMHIVEEICTGGSLTQIMERHGGYMSERDAMKIMKAVLEVVAHCHSMGVLYRDIKPDNFLLLDPSASYSHIKAIDFGISVFLKPGEFEQEMCGTPSYMAPEVFDNEYSLPSDVWSCGVMMYQLLSGSFPFNARTMIDLSREILTGKINMDGDAWRKVSPVAKDLLIHMMTLRPEKRYTAQEALHHPWFSARRVSMNGVVTQAIDRKGLANTMLQRLRSFSKMSSFQQEAMRQAVTRLDEAHVAGIKAMFRNLDKDGNGELSIQEILEGLVAQGVQIQEEEVQDIINHLDGAGINTINSDEFLAAVFNRSLLEKHNLLESAFKHFDSDGDGFITKEELQKGLTSKALEQNAAEEMLRLVDVDGNGKVDLDEFVAMMMHDNQGKERRLSYLGAVVGSSSSSERMQSCSIM
jgi:calcium-dependent protein kinase